MGSFGERLQREREMRGITLEEIAEATKIGTRSLRALEEQEFDKLPGGIFNKGFVRAYSRYLGIDEEQAVADYVAALAEAQAAGRATRPEPSISLPVEAIDDVNAEDGGVRRIAWAPLLLLVVLLLAAVGGWRYVSQHGFPRLRRAHATGVQPRNHAKDAQPLVQTAAATPVPSAPPSSTTAQAPIPGTSAQPVAVSAATNPASPAKPDEMAPNPGKGFVLRIRAKEDSWISLVADGKQVMSGVVSADTERSVRAQSSIVLKTGNAGGLELFRNQQPLPPLGPAKQVRQITITAEGTQP